jgi:Tol biopolymer transport system component
MVPEPYRSLHAAAPSCGTPRWSPDSEQIVFDSRTDGQWDIYAVAASGSKPRRLTNKPSFDAIPSWSGDGKWIYFCSDRSSAYQIWKMPAQGGEATQLTHQGGFAAVESLDGKSIYYTKSHGGTEGLWQMSVAGGAEAQVIDSVITNRAFSVAGDGIYFITGTQSRTLEFFSFRTQQHKTLAKLENPDSLSVSLDGRSILYSHDDQAGSDLMLVENFQ